MGDGVIGSPPAFGAVQSRFESESPSYIALGSGARSAPRRPRGACGCSLAVASRILARLRARSAPRSLRWGASRSGLRQLAAMLTRCRLAYIALGSGARSAPRSLSPRGVWHAAGRDTARLDRCRVVARLAVDRLATWVVLADRRTVAGRAATAYVAVGSDHRAGPGRGRGTAGDAADPARPDLPRPGPGHPGR